MNPPTKASKPLSRIPLLVISYLFISCLLISCQPVLPADLALDAQTTVDESVDSKEPVPSEELAADDAVPAEAETAAEDAAPEAAQPVTEETAPETEAEAVPEPESIEQELVAVQSVPAPLSVSTLSAISEVIWSLDEQWLAVAGSINDTEGGLVVYGTDDMATPRWQASSALLGGPQSVVISNDSQRLAAVTDSNNVTIWDINNGAVVADLAYGEFTPVTSVAFSPSGGRLAIGGTVGTAGLVKMIDLTTQGELFNIPYDQPFMKLSFHPGGQYLSGAVGHSCGPGAAFTFTIDLTGDLTDFDWRRDVEIQHAKQGQKMLTVGAYGQRCQFYSGDTQMVDTATKAITGNITRLAAVPTAHLSADGSAFTVDDGLRMEVWRDTPLRRVRVLDPSMGKAMAISPDGSVVVQVNANVITFVGAGGPNEAGINTAADTALRDVERFAEVDPATVASRYQRMEIPDGLLSITKASQSDPAILTFVVDQAAIDKYLMAVYNFESIQNWQGARYIEVDVRNGAEHSPLMIQLRERHADGRQGDSWRGSRAVPPFSEMTVSLLLEAGKGFNPIPTAPAGDGILDLDAIGTIELGVTSHHVMRGEMEVLAIRLFE